MKITEKMLNSLPKPTERLQALENNIMEKLFDEVWNEVSVSWCFVFSIWCDIWVCCFTEKTNWTVIIFF